MLALVGGQGGRGNPTHPGVKLTPEGERVLSLGEYGRFGDDEGHFNGPTGVAFLPDGRFVVSDGYWNSRLVWFDADGNYLKEVGELGNGPGQLAAVHAVARASRNVAVPASGPRPSNRRGAGKPSTRPPRPSRISH